jgi:hypothetical protein
MAALVRQVARVVHPRPVIEGAGVRLLRTIGGVTLDYHDPFLLLDHFESDDPDDYLAGFPLHPHRGIETVTYMLAGEVDHKDTLGNAGTIGPGDAQWMTAGGGIMHEEMPRPREGRMAGFQLWVNMPAALKLSRPRYQDVAAAAIPLVERPGGVRVRVVAGAVDGVGGPVTAISAEPEYLDVELPPRSAFTQAVPRGHAAFVYVYRGSLALGPFADGGGRPTAGGSAATGGSVAAGGSATTGRSAGGREGVPGAAALVSAPALVVLGDGDEVALRSGAQGARALLVSGAPLGEPIARYGPFVMNTRAELEQALRDLRDGTFVWTEERAG